MIELPITGMPRLVSSLTAFLLLSVLRPTPVTARSRSAPFVMPASWSAVCFQYVPVEPGLASTSRIFGFRSVVSWLAWYWAR